MLRSIWMLARFVALTVIAGISIWFFLALSTIVGQMIKLILGKLFANITKLPGALYDLFFAILRLIYVVITHPIDVLLAVMGGVIVIAIAMGLEGYFEDKAPPVRRGSRTARASDIRRKLNERRLPNRASGEYKRSLVAPRRGSQLVGASSVRNRISPPSSHWKQVLWQILPLNWFTSLARFGSPTKTSKRTSSGWAQPGRGRRFS